MFRSAHSLDICAQQQEENLHQQQTEDFQQQQIADFEDFSSDHDEFDPCNAVRRALGRTIATNQANDRKRERKREGEGAEPSPRTRRRRYGVFDNFC